MSDNMGSRANRLMKAIIKEPKHVIIRPFGEGTSTYRHDAVSTRSTAVDNNNEWGNEGFSFSDEEGGNGVARKVECRICHEDDHASNMEAPCACNGSLKVDIIQEIFGGPGSCLDLDLD